MGVDINGLVKGGGLGWILFFGLYETLGYRIYIHYLPNTFDNTSDQLVYTIYMYSTDHKQLNIYSQALEKNLASARNERVGA